MTKTFNKLFSLLILLGGLSFHSKAQDNNPILHFDTDVRSVGMGGILHPISGAPLLHTDPSLIFETNNDRLQIGYTLGSTLKSQGQTQTYHAASIGYKLSERHGLFGGMRYWNGSKTTYYNNVGAKMGEIYPTDVTVDLGYTFRASSTLSLYSTVTYLNAYSSRTRHAFMASLGASYRAGISILKSGSYGVGLHLSHLGTDLTHKDGKSPLPSLISLSSGISVGTWGDHLLSLGAMYSYQFRPTQAKIQTIRGGIEYTMPSLLSVRVGGQYEKDNNNISFGLGRKFGHIGLDLAYTMGMYPELNLLRAGLTFSI